jgi:hypothetical protein
MPKDPKIQIRAEDKTKAAFRSTQSGLKKITDSVLSVKSAMVLVAGAGFGIAMAKQATEAADAIGKFADRAGITTDRLQTLKFAFDLAGVGTEAVNKAMITFGKRLGKAHQGIGALAGGLKGGHEELLKSLKGTQNMNDALNIMFKAMGEASSQAEKLAIADAAFGAAGLRMTAAFRDGSRAFFEAEKRARNLGLVIDEDLIRNAEKLNDEMSVAGQVIKTQFSQVFLDLAPVITGLATGFTELTKSLRPLFKEIADNKDVFIAFSAGMTALLVVNKLTPRKLGMMPGIIAGLGVALATYADNAEAGADKTKGLTGNLKKLEEQAETTSDKLQRELFNKKFDIQAPRGMALGIEDLTPDPAKVDFEKSFKGLGKVLDEFKKIDTAIESIHEREFKRQEILRAEIDGHSEVVRLREAHKDIEEQVWKLAELQKMTNEERNALFVKEIKLQTEAFKKTEELRKQLEKQNELAAAGERIFDRMGDGFISAMQRGEDATESLRNVFVAALFDMQRELIKLALIDPFKKAAGGFLKDALGGLDLFGGGDVPGRAAGGPVTSGQPYIVGEKRPELFVPNSSGRIVPDLGGVGGRGDTVNIVNNFTIKALDARSVAELISQGEPNRVIVGSIQKAFNRLGKKAALA